MKKTLYVLSLLGLFIFAATSTQAQKTMKKGDPALKTFADSVSYAYGFLIGKQMKEMGEVDKEILKKGLDDQFANATIINEGEAQEVIKKAQQVRQRVQKEQQNALGKINLEAEKKFLAENIKQPGVGATPSGLQYKIVTEGTGARPLETSKVKVHYEGKLLDGTVFDSSYKTGKPISFNLNRVIKGWTEGVQLMKVGSKFQFFIPSALAYGKQGQRTIAPNSLLIFDIELLEIEE